MMVVWISMGKSRNEVLCFGFRLRRMVSRRTFRLLVGHSRFILVFAHREFPDLIGMPPTSFDVTRSIFDVTRSITMVD